MEGDPNISISNYQIQSDDYQHARIHNLDYYDPYEDYSHLVSANDSSTQKPEVQAGSSCGLSDADNIDEAVSTNSSSIEIDDSDYLAMMQEIDQELEEISVATTAQDSENTQKPTKVIYNSCGEQITMPSSSILNFPESAPWHSLTRGRLSKHNALIYLKDEESNEHEYRYEKQSGDDFVYRCNHGKTCGARVIYNTANKEFLKGNDNHSTDHSTRDHEKQIRNTIFAAKSDVLRGYGTSEVVSSLFEDVPSSEIPRLPLRKSFVRLLNRVNEMKSQSMNHLETPSFKGAPSLLFDSKESSHDFRCVAFGYEKNIEQMKKEDYYQSDGNYKTRISSLSSQTYTIGYVQDGHYFCAFYVLMDKSTEKAYNFVFQKVKEHLGGHVPTRWTIDCEMAARNAILTVFPNTSIHLCYLHFKRSLRRKYRSLGLDKKRCVNVSNTLKCISQLPLIELNDVKPAYEDLRKEIETVCKDNELTEFFHYVEKTWINDDSLFKRHEWSSYEHAVKMLPLTSNANEAFNNAIKCHTRGKKRLTLNILMRTIAKIESIETSKQNEAVLRNMKYGECHGTGGRTLQRATAVSFMNGRRQQTGQSYLLFVAKHMSRYKSF